MSTGQCSLRKQQGTARGGRMGGGKQHDGELHDGLDQQNCGHDKAYRSRRETL